MDGISEAASFPTIRRERIRTHSPHPSCTGSRWDGNGMRKAATARSTVCTDEACRSGVRAFGYQLVQIQTNRLPTCVEDGFSGVDDDVPMGRERGKPQPDPLAHSPFDAVTSHGAAESPGHGESDAGGIAGGALQAESREQTGGYTGPVVIDAPEIARTQQAVFLWKRESDFTGGPLRSEPLFRRSRSACAGPLPAAGKEHHGRPCFPCVHETHASWPACGCSAEKYVLASRCDRALGFQWPGALLLQRVSINPSVYQTISRCEARRKW